jgi:hypothetical protein
VVLALAAAGAAACSASVSLAFAPLVAAGVALGLTPVLARSLDRRAFVHRESLRVEVSLPVGSRQRRGSDARR